MLGKSSVGRARAVRAGGGLWCSGRTHLGLSRHPSEEESLGFRPDHLASLESGKRSNGLCSWTLGRKSLAPGPSTRTKCLVMKGFLENLFLEFLNRTLTYRFSPSRLVVIRVNVTFLRHEISVPLTTGIEAMHQRPRNVPTTRDPR